MPVEEVSTYEDLEKWINYNDNFYHVTVVFYHSDMWMQSKDIERHIVDFSEKMALIKFIKINIDNEEAAFAARNWMFEWDHFPAFQIYRQGRLVSEYYGYDHIKLYEKLKAWT